ncbi:aspartokinase 2, chloroplastic-like [Phalaenopsis equestris]|uniref:aspartokinase 2, chloroplastic-like n=1 Tax=Phalaenopsis equestris TaxID=78828 RepID=UPI0009E19581|nr:aspartokinase 2, chloroplastic-like [Phalaenopsis equestris]
MAIPLQMGVLSGVTGFGRNLQSSIGLLLNRRFAPGFEHFGRVSRKRGMVQRLRGRYLRICCQRGDSAVVVKDEIEKHNDDLCAEQLSIVMKFGGSSVATAERMREVANIILSFSDEKPVIVLSAMGKTTNKLLQAGEKAVSCGVSNVSGIDELRFIKDLHLRTANELGVEKAVISGLLEELEQLLEGIAVMKELTIRTRDYLMSFGECMSTRIFTEYLNKIGFKARQYDAFDIGFMTTDDFTNADILEATYPTIARSLREDWSNSRAIPIITGFLGKSCKSCAVTTLGRGGSDLTATSIGKALCLKEIRVWKDVDGVLTCDPNIHPQAQPVPYLTFEEAAELAYLGAPVLHPQSIRPARESDIPVRVKNSYNPQAPGCFNKHCFEVQHYRVGYCKHSIAWPVWFPSKGLFHI